MSGPGGASSGTKARRHAPPPPGSTVDQLPRETLIVTLSSARPELVTTSTRSFHLVQACTQRQRVSIRTGSAATDPNAITPRVDRLLLSLPPPHQSPWCAAISRSEAGTWGAACNIPLTTLDLPPLIHAAARSIAWTDPRPLEERLGGKGDREQGRYTQLGLRTNK